MGLGEHAVTVVSRELGTKSDHRPSMSGPYITSQHEEVESIYGFKFNVDGSRNTIDIP
jgi:hypothetical protein